MPIPDRRRVPCHDPRFRLLETDDGSWTLEHVISGDTFHSGCGAREECRLVYLENSGVGERLRGGKSTKVLEMGLGTATAFILTAAVAQRQGSHLHYTAIERDVLNANVFEQILLSPQQWFPEETSLCLELSSQLIDSLGNRRQHAKTHQFDLGPRVTLTLLEVDICQEALPVDEAFEGIYFDPFSPQSNPELWQEEFLRKVTDLLAIDGKLVSYCVNSQVRRTFAALGFSAQRVAGPVGGKREVLVVDHQS